MHPTARLAIASAIVVFPAFTASAAVLYSVPGSVYSQNFDSLPTDFPQNNNIETVAAYTDGWQNDVDPALSPENDVSIPGWYLYHPIAPSSENGFDGHSRLRVGPGANTGAFWLFGSSASNPEKALGSVGSTTTASNGDSMRIGLRLTNNTGLTLTGFTVTYDGEQWRDGQGTDAETMTFSYMTEGTDETNWHSAGVSNPATFVPQLAFTAPVTAGTSSGGTAVDGNTAGRIADISFTVTGISWAPGTDLWLRWSDPQLASLADDGLAIDNVRFSAFIPEPASLSLLALATSPLLRRRRRA